MRHRYQDTKRKYWHFRRRPSSIIGKVLDLLFVRALADRLRNMPVIVNAVDPGYAISGIRRNINGIAVLFFYFMDLLLAVSTEKSSRQLVFGALGGEGNEEKLRGAYLHYSRIGEPSDFVLGGKGQAVQENIWVRLLLPH